MSSRPEVKYEPCIYCEDDKYYMTAPDERWTLSKTEEQLKEYINSLEDRLEAKSKKLREIIMIIDPAYFDECTDVLD